MKKIILALSLLTISFSVFAKEPARPKVDTAKIIRYYQANGTGDGDTYVINSNQLVGAAAADYARLSRVKNCSSYGYCPEAYAITAYGTPTLAVAVSDDGGTYIDVFTADGKQILSCSAGESEDLSCSAK
ncbi:MAG: hypothetical protein ACXVAX_07390 [Pseudobdellovibrio sp.]